MADSAPMARTIDDQRARAAITRWRASGLSIAEFLRGEGLGRRTFYRWKAHVEASEAAAPRIVPVVLNSTRARGVAGEPFVVELGDDLRIRVAAGFDADELARLVEVLAGCRC